MSSDGLQKDGFGSLVLNESEDDSEAVACAASPGAFEVAFQFVRLQTGVKSVGREKFEDR